MCSATGPVHGFTREPFALVDIASMGVICDPETGTGKDINMTETRPPGGSVFLVEDEVMIRMMVADMLEELGFSIAAEAGEINEAIRLAQSTEFDLAILDVNVNGKVITPVAELIKARNRPFIFATGYGSSGLPEEYRDRPALQKPFQLETLAQMINTAMKSAAAWVIFARVPDAVQRSSRCSAEPGPIRFLRRMAPAQQRTAIALRGVRGTTPTVTSPSAHLKMPHRCGRGAAALPRRSARQGRRDRCLRQACPSARCARSRSRNRGCRGHRGARRL